MRPVFVFLCVALASTSFGQRSIQDSSLYRSNDNFPDVPTNHWVLDSLKKMKAEGLLVGYPYSGHGNRPPTRYELAVAVHATYIHTRNILETGLSGGVDNGKTGRQAALDSQEPLAKMTLIFSIELTNLGVYVPGMLVDLRKRFASVKSYVPREMIKTNDNASVVSEIALLESEHFVKVHHNGDNGEEDKGHPSDFDFALATYQAFSQIDEMVDRAANNVDNFDCVMDVVDLANRASQLQKLARKFSPQLTVLGIDSREMIRATSGWKTKTEDLWSAQGMRYWASSRS